MGAVTSLTVDANIAVPMRDGTVLRADVYRPAAPGRYPTLLTRTPYSKAQVPAGGANPLNPVVAAFAGYAVVVQDVRGRFESEGDFVFFEHEQEDGYDSVEWCAAQSWSTGRVGMFGLSYVGLTQWQAAIAGPPSLRAIVPLLTDADYHHGWTYDGGAFQLGFNLSWALLTHAMDVKRLREPVPAALGRLQRLPELVAARPLDRLPALGEISTGRAYRDWLEHPDDDDYWRRFNVPDRHAQITVPSLNIGGWYDLFTRGSITNYLGMRAGGGSEMARRGTRLVMGPWDHAAVLNGRVGDRQLSNRAMFLAAPLHLRWFDHWLKEQDTGLLDEPPVQVFVVGPDEWRTCSDWPPPGTRFEPMFLQSSGRANGLDGDGVLAFQAPSDGRPPDRYTFDPANPVPSRGGVWNSQDGLSAGLFDQRSVERRGDVLVYTSEPLEHPVEIVGPVTAVLWAETDAPDTDWTAKLVDVTPEGPAWNVCDGIIRARYRESFAMPVPITPGWPLEYTIDMRAAAYRFDAGHRIRLEVSSSSFPRFDVNPNTGTAIASERELQVARQAVYHDASHPSRVILPVQRRQTPED